MAFTLDICPVCGEQVQPDPEEGSSCFHREHGGYIEPVEVDVVPDAAQLRSRRALALFRLQEDRREADFREGNRRWFANLSVADRFWVEQRRIRERHEAIAQMGPMERSMAMLSDAWGSDLARQLFTDDPLLRRLDRGPDLDALDRWLAEDGRVPEVAAALGVSA